MRKKITTIFSIFFKQKNTRLDAPVAVFVEIQQITEARGRGLLQEPEGDALAVKIHGKHCDHYLLMEFQHLGRVIHAPARKAHLGDVYEAILLDAYVHESSEGCDIWAHLQSSVFKLSKDLIDSIHEEGIVAYTS